MRRSDALHIDSGKDNFINMSSNSLPLMLRAGFCEIFLVSLMLLFRYRAIVDKSFHRVMEWIVRSKRILGHLGRPTKAVWIT
jgi:hypothetical protein